jgi:hypothetical protein
MVGITIQNEVHVLDKPAGISFRRKDHLCGEIIWSVIEKVVQPSARYNALDKLIVTVHSIRMPIVFRKGIKSKVNH